MSASDNLVTLMSYRTRLRPCVSRDALSAPRKTGGPSFSASYHSSYSPCSYSPSLNSNNFSSGLSLYSYQPSTASSFTSSARSSHIMGRSSSPVISNKVVGRSSSPEVSYKVISREPPPNRCAHKKEPTPQKNSSGTLTALEVKRKASSTLLHIDSLEPKLMEEITVVPVFVAQLNGVDSSNIVVKDESFARTSLQVNVIKNKEGIKYVESSPTSSPVINVAPKQRGTSSVSPSVVSRGYNANKVVDVPAEFIGASDLFRPSTASQHLTVLEKEVPKKRKLVRRVVKKLKPPESESQIGSNEAECEPSNGYIKPKRVWCTTPNLPDVVLRRMFSMLTYKELCPMEAVCRRWKNIINDIMRRDIQEISIERLHIQKDAWRKYFSNVESLWLLIVSCGEEESKRFEKNTESLFTQLLNLTLQIHVRNGCYAHVAKCLEVLLRTHPEAQVDVELHADSEELVYGQIDAFPDGLSINKLKIICTDFTVPQLRLDRIYDIMAERHIVTSIMAFRDWSLWCSAETVLAPSPLETLRISSCIILSVDDLVAAFQETNRLAGTADEPHKKKKKVLPEEKENDAGAVIVISHKNKTQIDLDGDPEEAVLAGIKTIKESAKNQKSVKKVLVKKKKKTKIEFIKRLELAGQCRLCGLEFLRTQAHEELKKRLAIHNPGMEVDCGEIYYFE